MLEGRSWLDDAQLRRVQHGAMAVLVALFAVGRAIGETALVVALVAWILRIARTRQWHERLRTPLTPWLAAWLLVAAVSMTHSVDLYASLRGLQKLLKYFVLFFLVVDAVDSPQALRRLLQAGLVGMVLVVFDGVWQWCLGKDLFYGRPAPYVLDLADVKRINATFRHSASLAIYLVSVTPVALALGLRGTPRWRPWLFGIVGMASAVILLCRSRGGFLGFIGALLMVAWLLRTWAPAAFALLLAAIQALTIPPALKAWAATMPTLLHCLTEPYRLQIWAVAIEMIRAHPLIGVGVNTFVKAYPAYRTAGNPFKEMGPYAHNQYLHLTAELGLLGLAVFLCVLWQVGWAVRHRLSASASHPWEAVVAAGLGAGLTGYLIIGLLESSLYYAHGSLVFWLLVGALIALDRMVTSLARA